MPIETIKILHFEARIKKVDDENYISLTNIVNYLVQQNPYEVFRTWIKNEDTISFLEEWEQQFNPNFKGSQMASFRNKVARAKYQRMYLSLGTFTKMTKPLGIIYQQSRYGHVYAHRDIVLNFCQWFYPELYDEIYEDLK